ncbi:hypothetical protein E2C01_073640 [Portunus trituberculatus]|uniref:Major facilitator superfamily associated domain-containing protein n=1 Tax=Portunus trituberculatus TaxID=210409 RepID=A0A5B7IC80_PORTR|nr:hypothetical protein [Portunus trituberculatus]
MGAYASHISPPGALATVQSVFRSTFYIGVSTAGLLGGLLYNTKGGSIAFLVVGVFDLIYVLVFVLLHILINKYCSSGKFCSWHHSSLRHHMAKLFVLHSVPSHHAN